MPSWEWAEDHGGWFELAFVLTDDGFAHVVFIPDGSGTDPELLALCREFVGVGQGAAPLNRSGQGADPV